jgi:hypothetical protein
LINVVAMNVCPENNMKPINTLYERNEESLNVDVVRVYANVHLKGQIKIIHFSLLPKITI